MKVEIIKCDGCGKTEGVKQYKLDGGSEVDPSGNGYITNWLYRDWCFQCFKSNIIASLKPIELLNSVYEA